MKTKTYRNACLACMMLSAWTVMSVEVVAATPVAPTKMEQQDDKIKGNVSDADGGLIGASVKIKDTNVGTMTDMDGNFSIAAKKGDVLVISYIGYATQEITVTGAPIKVLMVDDEVAEFIYDQHCKALVDERGAMCLVGFGYRVSKIAYK